MPTISGVKWTNIYNYAAIEAKIASPANLLIPVWKTVAILLYSLLLYRLLQLHPVNELVHLQLQNQF